MYLSEMQRYAGREIDTLDEIAGRNCQLSTPLLPSVAVTCLRKPAQNLLLAQTQPTMPISVKCCKVVVKY